MQNTFKGLLIAASISMAFAGPAFAQAVDVDGATAGSTAKTLSGVKSDGKNPTAGIATPSSKPDQRTKTTALHAKAVITPKSRGNGAGKMAPLNGDQSGVALRADTSNAGPSARSAESTAHKTVYDPNNQLGTSLKGATVPDSASK